MNTYGDKYTRITAYILIGSLQKIHKPANIKLVVLCTKIQGKKSGPGRRIVMNNAHIHGMYRLEVIIFKGHF